MGSPRLMLEQVRARGARLVSVQIRPERPGEESAIGGVHGMAFAEPDRPERTPVEVALIEQLRASEAWLAGLSLVAVVDDRVIGHVVCSPAHVEEVPVLGLGPIGVIPAMQGNGIGSRLMQEVIAVAEAMGEPLIGLLGSPAYYPRFGFAPALDLAVIAPDPKWGEYFQVRTLSSYRPTITGRFRYAEAFERV